MGVTRTTQVQYEIIDDSISVLNNSINDIYIQQELGRLQLQLDSSVGDTPDQLIIAAQGVRDAYQTIINLMIASKDMLQMAKRLFRDCDHTVGTELGGE